MNKRLCSRRLPELLAPAGGREGFLGALKAGADAFYLGGEKFGARAYAENFTEAELVQTIHEAHLFDKKVYLTVNVLTRESELEDTLGFVQRLYNEGLDGVIVQDLGVLTGLKERCPGLLLHASTQMSVTGPEAVRYLKELGVSRVVPARELSLQEITALKSDEPIEVEAFIHGAMCYCYSGRCLMSSFLGGRSGNRGRCAGTCRLPYTILGCDGKPIGKDFRTAAKNRSLYPEIYPLSMRDMCVLEILPDLIDAGIDSFKIEGRMKKPEYAAGTTAFYRKYINRYVEWDAEGRREPWMVDAEDLKELHSLYIRSELSTGYYYRRNGRELLTIGRPGYAGADDTLLKEIDSKYLNSLPQIDIRGRGRFAVGEQAELTVTANEGTGHPEVSVTVRGDIVQPARSRPMSADDIEQRLRRTGETFFRFEKLHVTADGEGFLPVSSLNVLRREVLDTIGKQILKASEESRFSLRSSAADDASVKPAAGQHRMSSSPAEMDLSSHAFKPVRKRNDAERLWAQVMTCDQLQAALKVGVKHIIIEDTPELEQLMRYQRLKSMSGRIETKDLRSLKAEINAAYKKQRVQFCLALPHICRQDSRPKVRKLIDNRNENISGFLVRNIEELVLLREMGYSNKIIADGSLYQWNRRSQRQILEDCDSAVLPWELSAADLKPLMVNSPHSNIAVEPCELFGCRELLTVYGRLPMMVTAGCVRKTEGVCTHEDGKFLFLEDRKSARFPVRCSCEHCYNIVYNSVPLSLHNFFDHTDGCERDSSGSGRTATGARAKKGKGSGGMKSDAGIIIERAGGLLCSFTTESGKETAGILRFFGGQDRSQPPVSVYTNGHFRKSAL